MPWCSRGLYIAGRAALLFGSDNAKIKSCDVRTLVGNCNGDGRRGAGGWPIWYQLRRGTLRRRVLATVPDVLGLHTRQPEVAVVKVLLGRDTRSVCALVPDPHVIHDVTVLDMGDSVGPVVPVTDLSLLRLQWPVSIITSLSWLQQELKRLRTASKKRYRDILAGSCSFCRKWIKLDMQPGTCSAVALPGFVVHRVEGDATGLYGSLA